MIQYRTALITGAASGIGRCFAAFLSTQASKLILLDIDEPRLTATATSLGKSSADLISITADVADGAALDARLAELAGLVDSLDLLINCAAILGPGEWARQSPADFERVLRVDLIGTANVIRGTLPWLRRARGHIVNMASTAAVHGWPGLAAYSAAKFAVVGYSEGIRAELAREGIGLTLVFPLLIDTPLLSQPGTPPLLRSGRRIPPEIVVRKVLQAATRRRRRVYIPGSVRLLAALHGLAPSLLDWYGTRFGLE